MHNCEISTVFSDSGEDTGNDTGSNVDLPLSNVVVPETDTRDSIPAELPVLVLVKQC